MIKHNKQTQIADAEGTSDPEGTDRPTIPKPPSNTAVPGSRHEVLTPHCAAYNLGYSSRILRRWQNVYWDKSGMENTENGVPLTVEDMRKAMRRLVREIHPSIYVELITNLDEAMNLNGRVPEMLAISPGGRAPGFDAWRNLCEFVDDALRANTKLQNWLDLGTALGDLQLEADEAADVGGPTLPVDVLHAFTERLRALRTDVEAIPVLRRWLDLFPKSNRAKTAVFLRKIKVDPTLELRTGPIPGSHDAYYVMMALHELNVCIQSALRESTVGKDNNDVENGLGMKVISAARADPALPAPGEPRAMTELNGSHRQPSGPRDTTKDNDGSGEVDRKPATTSGYLDLTLFEDGGLQARRSGYEPIEFHGYRLRWRLLRALHQMGGRLLTMEACRSKVWDGKIISQGTIYAEMSHLNKMLERLGLWARNFRKVGYRLEVLSDRVRAHGAKGRKTKRFSGSHG